MTEPEANLNLPKYSVSGFSALTSPVEVILLATSLVPTLDAAGTMTTQQRPEIILAMSPQSAKELAVILTQLTLQYEAEFGTLRTHFLDGLNSLATGNA